MSSGTAPLRAWMGIAVVALLCLNMSLDLFNALSAYFQEHPDPLQFSKQERRFARLHAELPEGSILAYYSDLPLTGGGTSAVFYTVLYTMAPHLLTPGATGQKPELVLGNFTKPPDLTRLQQDEGMQLVKDYKGGVMLFKREGK